MAEKAQVGDLIRVVDANPYEDEEYENGDIYEVLGRFGDGDVGVYVNKKDYFGDVLRLYDREYVIHRKAGEEDEKPCGGESSISEQYTEIIERRKQASEDAVNHPSHYTQGRFETIEIIEEITQGYSDGYVAYCVGNALKYLARAPFKHESPLEDIAKARAYLDFAIKRLGGDA